MSFDSLFFLLYGIYSLIMGILNKGNACWMFIPYASKRFLEKKYVRATNMVMGVISILIGIALYNKQSK